VTIIVATINDGPMVLDGVDVPMTWDLRADRIKQSILIGIEQARMNLGTIQTDADLTIDDKEE